ncbi:MAG: tRNA 4-thiouridine(8) synthase ThiI [Methanoregulaceae archaeon]|nr:tRNA 4-thiouridine(8) synthase ThiI [Methanoregulaceae archaeon]
MNVVMIRFGELFLKSEPVKRHFIMSLTRNIGKALQAEELSHRFELHRGRILIHGGNPERIAQVAGRIFGIVEAAVCHQTGNTLAEIAGVAVEIAKTKLGDGVSFAVRARREGVPGLTSQEIGAQVGSALHDAYPGSTVNLSNPEYEIFVEVRDFGALLYDTAIPAPGGLPWGTQGKVLSLLSSGIDSPVAAWLMMKRGCETASLHIDGGKYAGNDVRATAEKHHAILSTWCAGFPMDLLVVDAEAFYDTITKKGPARYRCILCKRFMLRLGSAVTKDRNFEALVTGDNLGQVASQTLTNMATISEAATVPVLRPLIGFDKEEVVRLSRKIGTFDQKQGDLGCRAVPKTPATAALPDEIHEAEAAVGMEQLIEEAVERVSVIRALNGKFLP